MTALSTTRPGFCPGI